MNLPDFDGFREFLTEEKIVAIANTVNEQKMSVNFSLTQEGMNSLLTKISVSNIIFTLELLKEYHCWLSENLEK